MKRLHALILSLSAFCLSATAAEKTHGLALYGPQDLKYKAGEHYHWVNLKAPKEGMLTISDIGSFTKLNPFSLKGNTAPYLSALCFQSLGQGSLDPEEPFSVYGNLAEGFSLADDALSLICHLHPKARFSDGTPVTADDVIFSYNLIFDAEYSPQTRAILSDIKEAIKVDQHTVKFVFKALNKELPLIVTTSLPILPKHVYGLEGKSFGKDFDEAVPVGSGPYKVSDFDKSSFITYVRDANWWAKDVPINQGRYNFDKIKVSIFLDPNPELQALKSGLLDAKGIYSSKYWHLEFNGEYFQKGYCVRKLFKPTEVISNMQGFVINLRKEKFQDIRVRKAIASVFDFEHMNKNLFYGQYERCISYWNSSKEMSTRGPAEGKEREILLELAKKHNKPEEGLVYVPKDAIIRGPYVVGAAPDGSVFDINDRIIAANRYLDSIGWTFDQKAGTRQKDGVNLTIEFLLYSPGFERICTPYIELLREIGIKARIQLIQIAEFIKRANSFDFDLLTNQYGGNPSPGNELKDWFGTQAADIPGSSNLFGIKNPAIDEVIEKVIVADNRKDLVLYTKVLDRILCANHYIVPQWGIVDTRAVYWNRIKGPEVFSGKGIFRSEVMNFWWYEKDQAERLKQAMDKGVPFTLDDGGNK